MQIQLNQRENGLEFAVADLQGNVLLGELLSIKDDEISEEDIIRGVNQITERLTGVEGNFGTSIAFTLKQPSRKKIIALTNTHGMGLRRSTNNKEISLLPRWSPDSTKLLYTTVGNKGTTIWMHNVLNNKADELRRGEDGVTSGGGTVMANVSSRQSVSKPILIFTILTLILEEPNASPDTAALTRHQHFHRITEILSLSLTELVESRYS